MTTTNLVSIPLSKSKTFVWLIGAIAFVVLGVWLLCGQPVFENALFDNPWLTETVGAASLIFFGIASYFLVRNLMAQGPGLIIDSIGIEDFLSAASASRIYWKDIEAIEILTIQSHPIILFKVTNPRTYIDQEKGIKRKMMALNYKGYGTPLSISANGLQVSFEELLPLIIEKYEAYTNDKNKIVTPNL